MRSPYGRRGRAAAWLVGAAAAGLLVALALFAGDEDGDAPLEAPALAPEERVDVGALEARGRVVAQADASAREEAAPAPKEWSLVPTSPDSETAPYRVLGRVVDDATGAPVADAEVRAWRDGHRDETDTDAEGRFALAWSEARGPDLSVAAEGYADLRRAEVALDRELELRLTPAASLEVRVAGERPDLAGALLLPRDRSGTRTPERRCDADGVARFDGLAPGPYLLGVSAPTSGLVVRPIELASGEAQTVELTLVAGATLVGRVVLRETNAGVADVRLTARPSIQGAWRGLEEWGEVETTTDESGAFRLEHVHPERVSVRIVAPWGGDERRGVQLDGPGRETRRDFELDPPAAIAGTVFDADGRPVAGASVRLAPERARSGTSDWIGADFFDGATGETVTTDAAGRFRLERVAARERHRVLAQRFEDSGPTGAAVSMPLRVQPGEEHADLVLRLATAAEKEGRVEFAGGAPQETGRLRLYREEDGGYERWSRPEWSEPTRFRVDRLYPGRYTLRADCEGYEPVLFDFEWPAAADDEWALRLESVPHVDVRVVDEDGDAVPYATVRWNPTDHDGGRSRLRRERTDEFGRTRLDGLPHGGYELSAHAIGYEGADALVDVPRDGELVLALRRRPRDERAVVTGRFVTAQGAPPENLRLHDRRGGMLTVENGRFRLDGARPGRAQLVFDAWGCLPSRTRVFDLPPGGEVDLGVLELAPGSRLWVVLVDDDGLRVRDAQVRIAPLPRASGGPEIDDDSGRRRLRHSGGGRYGADEVARGAWRLVVDAPGHRSVRRRIVLDEALERVELDLEPDPNANPR